MTDPSLAITYDSSETEPRIYKFWLDNGYFAPSTNQLSNDPTANPPPFVITLPPPNITGELHVGHALCYLAQDIVGRRARMQGRPTLLLPGLDHAGIATQNVVERQLAAEGLGRHDLGRAGFEARCWQFMNQIMPTIRRQFQRLGFSFDWSRERFTLDRDYCHAVNHAFVYFFRKGWIYRGYRQVNYCSRCATSISDLEVEHVERQDTLYTIEYRVQDSAEGIRVATTRPETMLGDTAVAVHPSDLRYADLIGRIAILPLLGRSLPIIADEAVDPQFGTGAVKITPAHDPTDEQIAQRHALETINVIGEDGYMTQAAGPYAGLTTVECRRAVVEALERQGLLIQQELYCHNVGTCERCHTVIEPLMSRQWFMRMDGMVAPAIAAVQTGRVRIEPKRWERVYLHWMDNIRDWCISRQLWWGHRIPIWTCADCGGHSTLTADDLPPTACEDCGSPAIAQETDVLDTWFSAALWPFASLGWPIDSEDLRRYYPGHFLGTAGEIIFLWVARMIMEGLEFMGQEPFSRVYINPTVQTEDGRRMSKSLGTGIDPLIACEQYGADAIRWALIRDNTLAQTVRFSDARADEGRRFANKLWNAARFILANQQANQLPRRSYSLPERWIHSRLNATIAACDVAYDGLRFDLAAQALYEFIWGEFCDWYLEIAKQRLDRPTTQATLLHCLDGLLRLLHPLMPHITEEIWSYLRSAGSPALIVSPWPAVDERDGAAESEMALLTELIQGIRNARAVHRVSAGVGLPALLTAADPPALALLADNRDWLAQLARLDAERLTIYHPELAEGQSIHPPAGRPALTVGPFACYLEWAIGEDERQRLEKELSGIVEYIRRSEELLTGEFSRRAPAPVVAREQAKLAELKQRRKEIQKQLAR